MATASRAQQTASLQRTVPAVKAVSGDDSLFDVGIRLSENKVLTLRTELPPDFPFVPPILRIINPGATHSWLDGSGRVCGLDLLYHWDARTSDLGQVVQSALNEFCMRPPHVNPGTTNPQRLSQRNLPINRNTASSSGRNLNGNNAPKPSHTSLQPINLPSTFSEIEKLSQEEAQKLLDNEEAFSKLFSSLSVVTNVIQLKEAMRKSNVEKANENLNKDKEIQVLQEEVKNLQQICNDVRREYGDLVEQQKAMNVPLNPRMVADELEILAQNVDDESEQLRLFDDPSSIDANLLRYRQLRLQYHLRKAKSVRCKELYS